MENDPRMVVASQGADKRAYVYEISTVAALGGLLFGYDTAVISGTVGSLETKFELSPLLLGWTVASVLLGCMAGAVLAGPLSDRFGRKKALLLSAWLFLVSAIGSFVPQNITQLILARLVGGVGVGMASLLSPMYIAELAPPRIRGRLVSINQFMIILGMLVVYFVNARIAAVGDDQWNVQWGWRYMFGSEAVPAGLFLVMLALVPESPRWLVQKGRLDEAERILARTGGAGYARTELQDIRAGLMQEEGSWGELVKPGFRVALLIGLALAIIQQTTGINVILYYTPEIFKSAGSGTIEAMDSTVIVGVVNLALTVLAFFLVDWLGRKPLMLIASAGMGLMLAGVSFFFNRSENRGLFVLLGVLGYVAFFAIAMGPVTWVIISEIFPNRIRGRAMSICVLVLWGVNFCVSTSFPYMLKLLQGAVFYPFAVMCVLAVLFIALVVPETKNKTLEDIERHWLKARR